VYRLVKRLALTLRITPQSISITTVEKNGVYRQEQAEQKHQANEGTHFLPRDPRFNLRTGCKTRSYGSA
jgi:hypothetical protein